MAWVEGRSVWLRRYRGGRWEGLGGSDQGRGLSGEAALVDQPSLALDGKGQPFVAWCHDRRIFLRFFSGGRWLELDGSASGGGLSGELRGECRPSVALDSSGHPWVAWARYRQGQNHGGDLLLRRWDGSRWREVGGTPLATGFAPQFAQDVNVALTGDDRPVLAWLEREGPRTNRFWVMVVTWNGERWQGLGPSAAGRGLVSEGTAAYRPRLALDPRGHPTVVWNALVGAWGDHDIYLKRWDGHRWLGLGGSGAAGGISSNQGNSGGQAVAVDSDGNPTVVWNEGPPGNGEVFLRRFLPARYQ